MTALVCLTAVALASQQKGTREQTPRQAILEMFSGSEEAFRKHLTLDVQTKLKQQGKDAKNLHLMQSIAAARAPGGQGFDSFEAGPVLFSFNNAQQHERLEVHMDGEDLRGDEDVMELSLHTFRAGVEEDLPGGVRLQLAWRQQEGLWRITALAVNASVPLGDPRILDRAWWDHPSIASLHGSSPATAVVTAPVETNSRPKMPPARSVRLIGLAENLHMQKHPDMGFTCSLAALVEIGRGFDNGEPYKFMDPEFAEGIYDGYKFTLTGCAGKTVKAFQVMAEPLNGKGKAYCSDQTRDLRASDDGSGTTCLASGKFVRQ